MKKLLLILGSLLAFASFSAPLPANEAFQLTIKPNDSNSFVLNWQVKPGYFLYRDRIHITLPEDSNITLGDIHFPPFTQKTDAQGRVFNIYRKQLFLITPILGQQAGETLVNISYQGCADDGFCYPPETRQAKLIIDNQLALSDAELYHSINNDPSTVEASDTEQVASLFSNHHWSVVLLIFFGFGLLLSLTPCVLPMVPVLSGIIIGHGENLSTRKAFFLSLSYVISMALTYAVMGAVVAMLGSNLQIMMQTPWVIGLFSLIFVLLAFSMFGYYDLKLPLSWQAKLAQCNRSQASGHYLSAALMGCLSILILSPCVTAPLIGALSYIASTGNVIMGSLSLFVLALGMGTPLLLIGLSAGRFLPKAGVWMNTVKAFFGVLMLALAIMLLARIISPFFTMILWAILLIFTGIYAGALTRSQTHQEKFKQAFGIIFLAYGLFILFGASMGETNPLQPLSHWQRPSFQPHNNERVIKNRSELKQALKEVQNQTVLLDFYAEWCSACKIMESTTFKHSKVKAALDQLAVIKVDITSNDQEAKALLQEYNVIAPPTFLFLKSNQKEGSNIRLVGEVGPEKFLHFLEQGMGR